MSDTNITPTHDTIQHDSLPPPAQLSPIPSSDRLSSPRALPEPDLTTPTGEQHAHRCGTHVCFIIMRNQVNTSSAYSTHAMPMPMPMPQYSLMPDRPWAEQPARKSSAPSASVYSEDDYQTISRDSAMPDILPLRLYKEKHHHYSTAHEIPDHGPQQVRHSRLPLFKQVRSMLHKPSKLDMSRIGRPRESSQSSTSEVPDVKHPSRQPSRDTYEVRRHWPEQDSSSSKETSPVSAPRTSPNSALRDSDMERAIPPGSDWQTIEDYECTPDSDVADFAYHRQNTPSQVSANARAKNTMPETHCPTARLIEIKRKPAPHLMSQSQKFASLPPRQSLSPPPSCGTDCDSVAEIVRDEHELDSRFSWTTYGGTTPARPSFDLASRSSVERPSTSDSGGPRNGHPMSRLGAEAAVSRFSWSTVNTSMPPNNQNHADSPPSSPRAMVPTRYKTPPVQSILSRHRPIQRHQEREEWTLQPRKLSSTAERTADTPASAAKTRLNIVVTDQLRSATTESPGSAKKSLPLPPVMMSPASPMSHLETLLAREQDMSLQRRNIEKAIVENSKIETASPMDVAFSEVRQAKKELEMLRVRLEEIRLEEREIGIAIARARRKEAYGEEEGLWVRRVTG